MSNSSELAHLFRELKAPAAARALPKLAERARVEEWSYEEFAQALLSTEVSAREAHGGEGRIRSARFPARKTLEEFDFTFQRSLKKTVIEHLGHLDFLHAKENVILLGPPGTGKTHLGIASGIRACLAGQRVIFTTATEWVARSPTPNAKAASTTSSHGSSAIPLLICDEVGYIPFDPASREPDVHASSPAATNAPVDDRHLQQALRQSAQVRVKVWAVVCSAHTFANAAASVSTAPIR